MPDTTNVSNTTISLTDGKFSGNNVLRNVWLGHGPIHLSRHRTGSNRRPDEVLTTYLPAVSMTTDDIHCRYRPGQHHVADGQQHHRAGSVLPERRHQYGEGRSWRVGGDWQYPDADAVLETGRSCDFARLGIAMKQSLD